MKNTVTRALRLFFLITTFSLALLNAQNQQNIKEISGKIIDQKTKSPLIFADLVVNGSNISTVTNKDGEFLLKIPSKYINEKLVIAHLGYEKKELDIANLKSNEKIMLTPSIIELSEVNISTLPYDAKTLVIKTLKNKNTAYSNNNALMTAFYRETIKKRKRNALLSEAIVKIHKQPYASVRSDRIELIKSRKKVNYTRLDTLAVKLQGGPFSNLYSDLVKYPQYVFAEGDIDLYNFNYVSTTNINKKIVHVVSFKEIDGIEAPMYYGKLYIDAKNLALIKADYSLNVENRELSSQMFVRKKPRRLDVYPTEANYSVKYRTTNGKWHYNYSNMSLTFKVNWKGKLFNNIYTLSSEMAITNWEVNDLNKIAGIRNRIIKPSTILTEQTSGFTDPKFWGAYNIIEPEKSIENAIKKIQKRLKKIKEINEEDSSEAKAIVNSKSM